MLVIVVLVLCSMRWSSERSAWLETNRFGDSELPVAELRRAGASFGEWYGVSSRELSEERWPFCALYWLSGSIHLAPAECRSSPGPSRSSGHHTPPRHDPTIFHDSFSLCIEWEGVGEFSRKKMGSLILELVLSSPPIRRNVAYFFPALLVYCRKKYNMLVEAVMVSANNFWKGCHWSWNGRLGNP